MTAVPGIGPAKRAPISQCRQFCAMTVLRKVLPGACVQRFFFALEKTGRLNGWNDVGNASVWMPRADPFVVFRWLVLWGLGGSFGSCRGHGHKPLAVAVARQTPPSVNGRDGMFHFIDYSMLYLNTDLRWGIVGCFVVIWILLVHSDICQGSWTRFPPLFLTALELETTININQPTVNFF